MRKSTNSKKLAAFIAVGFFVITGTYNAVVINSESHLSSTDMKFAKRLDEVYGVVKAGREVAATTKWQKLSNIEVAQVKQMAPIAKKVVVTQTPAVVEDSAPVAAAVQEELNLNLVEVVNPTKWPQGVAQAQISGNLSTNNGIIESLSVSLPNGEGVSVSFSEMAGNVFEYDLNGELYSGMMYQVDQNSYMVTLTNGPLEGTRLRFNNSEAIQSQEYLAENHQVEAGEFGAEASMPVETAGFDSQEAPMAQGFNFEQVL